MRCAHPRSFFRALQHRIHVSSRDPRAHRSYKLETARCRENGSLKIGFLMARRPAGNGGQGFFENAYRWALAPKLVGAHPNFTQCRPFQREARPGAGEQLPHAPMRSMV